MTQNKLETGKKPIFEYKAGAIKSVVWKNTMQINGNNVTKLSTTISKLYKKGEEWGNTFQFNPSDLGKVAIALHHAQTFVYSYKEE